MMGRRIYFGLFIALCILASALAARPTHASSYKVQRRRVGASDAARHVHHQNAGESHSRTSEKEGTEQSSAVEQSAGDKSETVRLLKVAKAIARSHSTSEVLTLNLTNLLILIVLKAIIFGIGLFYFGGVTFKGSGGHGWSSRSLEKKSGSFMSEGELLLMLTYLLGSTDENYECMYRVACEEPSKAKEYLKVSKMILKGAKFMKK